MKLLLNMNLPRELGRRLVASGYHCRHVGDIALATAQDELIVTEARRAGETIVTHDLDYGAILAFSGEAAPSVIILRTANTHPDHLFERLLEILLPNVERALTQGAIVVIEDSAARIRRLPID